jgi:hypothetical protein
MTDFGGAIKRSPSYELAIIGVPLPARSGRWSRRYPGVLDRPGQES